MQLIDRALNALEILSQNMNGMSVTDLAEQLGIPASSTHRILSSLKGNHFVVQDEHTKKYRHRCLCADWRKRLTGMWFSASWSMEL